VPQLHFLDWSIIAIYFGIVFSVALYSARGKTHARDTPAGYFLAGRNVGWFVIGASLFASNIGSEHLVGLAGTAAATGMAVGQFEVQASLVLLLLGWVFVPFYLKSGVFTMPEFLERRYSSGARWYLAVISIVGYVLTKISVTIAAGGIVFEALMGIPFWWGAITIVIVTGIYTTFGGLRAVLYTDMFQAFVLIGGALMVTLIGLYHVGGWAELQAVTPPMFMSLWKPMSDPDFPWTGILFGAPILGVWYWCTDQFIVQRVLSARNIDNAQRGAIFAGLLKVLPLFLFVLPGVIAYALVQQGKLTLETADHALPTLIGTLLPLGVRGLVVAGLLAALMSSLSSVFNSCSTLVTWDIYRKLRPQARERELVTIGQVSTLVLVGLGLAWVPLMGHISEQLYTYLQSVQGYIAPPIAAVFLMGIFWRRVNAAGAIASLITGFVLGMSRLVMELNKTSLTQGTLAYIYADVNFLHFAIGLFAVCVGVLVAVSLVTRAPDEEHVRGLTFQTTGRIERADAQTLHIRVWRRPNVILTALLIAAVLAVWLYFSPLFMP